MARARGAPQRTSAYASMQTARAHSLHAPPSGSSAHLSRQYSLVQAATSPKHAEQRAESPARATQRPTHSEAAQQSLLHRS
eukprot:CAMPEP_0180113402 /NCGR_PEP_ID=MMETSP0985-20121206/36751_1 /TAXON_ID=483367 /ORGANISM="non described non described, Strain CCMP 2436" /LENGTH=80 /DNA_ID=CAMNT_0022051879 /DNA_START=52 /DNA_END=289 /DNA_ORIENTATION=+